MHQIRGKMREKIVKFHNLRSNISSGNLGLFLGPSGGAGSLTSNVNQNRTGWALLPSGCVKCSNIDVQSRELQPHCSICMRLGPRLLCTLKCIFNAPAALSTRPASGLEGPLPTPCINSNVFPTNKWQPDPAWTLSQRYMNRQTNG